MTKANGKAAIYIKSMFTRITLTPHTLAFFLLSVIHCLAQGLTATFIYTEDANTFGFVNNILRTAEVPRNEVARLFRDGNRLDLELCTAAPVGDVYKECATMWETGMAVNATGATYVPRALPIFGGAVADVPSAAVQDSYTPASESVTINDILNQVIHQNFARRGGELISARPNPCAPESLPATTQPATTQPVTIHDILDGIAHQQFVRRSLDGTALTAIRDPSTKKVTAVEMTYNNGADSVVLSEQCARMLEYPGRILDNSQREDLALIGSQFWLLGISTFGILWNSIPHIWAVVFARVMQTSWAAYTVWRTTDVRFRYRSLIVDDGTPCNFDFMPSYFNTRLALQIPELVLNVTALISTTFLAFHIAKSYSSSTIRTVGPPPRVMRLYKFFLLKSMFLQLSLFFTITAISLWIDQLRNSEIAVLAQHAPVYYALFVFTVVTIIPWMAMGWFAVRREMTLLMAGFMLLTVFYLAGWSAMFKAQVYLWTFIEWPFFCCMTVVSSLVLLGALVFGIVCWTGFGQGLAHYLHVEAVLMESGFDADLFTNDDSEKASSQATSPSIRCPSALADPSPQGVSTIRRDGNWDFADADVDKPRIYMVDFAEEKGSSTLLPK